MKITRKEHQELNQHKSMILWFTGLSGAGKTTLAEAIEYELYKRNFRTYLLDGDHIRKKLNHDLGFSKQDRVENIRRISEVAKLFLDAGVIVLVSAISPYQKDRDRAKSIFDKNEFIEIYTKCPLSICEKRDPKGLYKKAKAGAINNFTGISQAYEEPLNPDLQIDTSIHSKEASLAILVNYILKKV